PAVEGELASDRERPPPPLPAALAEPVQGLGLGVERLLHFQPLLGGRIEARGEGGPELARRQLLDGPLAPAPPFGGLLLPLPRLHLLRRRLGHCDSLPNCLPSAIGNPAVGEVAGRRWTRAPAPAMVRTRWPRVASGPDSPSSGGPRGPPPRAALP